MSAPIGYEIRKMRQARDLSVAALSRLAQVPASTLSMIETGKNRPSYATTRKLILALEGGRLGPAFESHERVVYHRGFRRGQSGRDVPRRYQY